MANNELSEGKTPSLFHIKQLGSKNFSEKKIEYYLDDEKMGILGEKYYKSKNFKLFIKDYLKIDSTKADYLIGLQTNSIDWLMEMFANLSQSRSFLEFHRIVKKNILSEI